MMCVQARLHAMEGKILKGAARGGLVELTRVKEEQLKRREEELQRRSGRTCHSVITQPSPCQHSTAQHCTQHINQNSSAAVLCQHGMLTTVQAAMAWTGQLRVMVYAAVLMQDPQIGQRLVPPVCNDWELLPVMVSVQAC
jgi:hypothetical protein